MRVTCIHATLIEVYSTGWHCDASPLESKGTNLLYCRLSPVWWPQQSLIFTKSSGPWRICNGRPDI